MSDYQPRLREASNFFRPWKDAFAGSDVLAPGLKYYTMC